MSQIRKHWIAYLSGVIIVIVILNNLLSKKDRGEKQLGVSHDSVSVVPDINELTYSDRDDLVRYGKTLIDSTSKFFGPHGSIASITNGLNCENCHRESGTKLYTNNFLSVASTYPKFRERSGRLESVEWRVNECMQRSLNGEPLDSLSKEMRAMVAYIQWTGKNIHKNEKIKGVGNYELPFLPRAADVVKGKTMYLSKCASCHGKNGEGVMSADGASYVYPPLSGEHSYAVSAGMFRLTKLASFIKNNMPLGATYTNPMLSNEEAWDLAGYINSQPHPRKKFPTDWPVLSTKPVDYPFGPYADSFTEKQHKYGPFDPIKKAKDMAMKK
jgi:thiosulfate dehydrogenase